MGGNSSPSGNTTTTSAPPEWQQPYMEDFLQRSGDWMNQRYGYTTPGTPGTPGTPAGGGQTFDQWFAQNQHDYMREVPGENESTWEPNRNAALQYWKQNVRDQPATPGTIGTPGEVVPGNAEYTPGFETVAGFNPYQTQGQNMAMDYAGGQGANLAGAAQQALQYGINPANNPFLTGMSGNFQGQQDFLSQMMGQQGQGPTTPQIGFSPQTPQINFSGQTPQIGFDPQRQQVDFTPGEYGPDPTAAMNSMMSATPNMDVYSPLYSQMREQATTGFLEDVMPALRGEAQAAGQYGDPKHQQSMGIAADRVNENMTQAMERLTQQAASEALNQRAQGTGMAANYGLGLGAQGLAAGTTNANLGQAQQNLGAGLATSQAGLGAGQNALLGNLAATQAGLGSSNNALLGNLATNQAGLDLSTQQLGESMRSNQAGEGLSAAGLYGSQLGGMYGTSMDAMGRSMAMAPSVYDMGMQPANVYSGIGAQQQAMTQAQMDDQAARWEAEQLGPYGDLARYQSMVMGNIGYGTQSQPYYQPSSGQNMLGAGMAGLGTYGMLAMNPATAPYALAGGLTMGALGLM